MTQCKFAEGARIKIENITYHMRRKLSDDKWQLESDTDGEYRAMSEIELRTLYQENKLTFVVNYLMNVKDVKDAVKEKINLVFSDFPEPLRNLANIRLKYVQVYDTTCPEDLEKELLGVSRRIGNEVTPAKTTIAEWSARFRKSGSDIRSLIPLHSSKGNRKSRYSDEVIDISVGVIQDSYLTEQRDSQKDTVSLIKNAIEQANVARPGYKKLPKPGRKFLRNLIGAMSAYEVMRARFGKEAANRHFRESLKSGADIYAPLARVEMDHTVLDVIVIHPKTLMPLGRPTITLALDRGTRCVLGYYISFEPANYIQMMKCLAHAIKPKDYILTKYPNILNPWPCWGIPQLVVVDNGLEFHSIDFETAAQSLLMDIRYCPAKQPWWKGSVERFFGKQNKGLIHYLPGSTFSNPNERGDYKSVQLASVTLDLLDELIHTWICDVYHQTVHRSTLRTPASLWRERINPVHQLLPPSAELLDVALASTETRTVFHYGINLNNLNYNSKELMALRRQKDTIKVQVRWDRSDLGYIHVFDEDNGEYIKVPCTWFNYASGVSLWLHKIIRRDAESHEGVENQVKLDAAKARLRELCQQALSDKRSATRKKAARAEPGLAANIDSSYPVTPDPVTSSPSGILPDTNINSEEEIPIFARIVS